MTPLALLALGLAAEPARELVHFGPAGPTRIRVQTVVRGAEVDAAWAAAVGRLFALLDRDGNGTLDKAEQAAVVAPARRPRTPVPVFQDPAAAAPLRLEFPGDGPVDGSRFAAAVRAAGLGPVTLAVTPPRADAAAVSAALLKRLDADGDGRLSAAELLAARDRLAALDADEDECLTPAELLDRPPVPGTPAVVQPVVAAADPPTDLLLTDPAGGPAVKQVLAARGPNRATALKRAEFGADERPFAAFDQDGNGRLDSTELAAWLDHPADAAVTLDLPAGRVVGDTAVSRPGLRVRFDPPTGGPPDAWAAAVKQLGEQAAGLTKGGPADRKAATAPPVAALFDLADRNADGKLDAAEAAAAVAVLAGLGDARLALTVADHGAGLFELLDADGDGRLSPRELLGAAAAVRPFADAAGTTGPADLPRRLAVSTTPQPLAVVLPAPPPAVARAARPEVPAWFAGLDRNGDGDVSRREFVGPDTVFRRLDADGDGLISPAEVRAAGPPAVK